MFLHIYTNRIRASLRDKDNLVWTWIFPIMMATLFFFAFSGIDSAGRFSAISVAVVNNEAFQNDTVFSMALKQVSQGGKEQLLQTTYVDNEDMAAALLGTGDISGYIIIQDNKPILSVKETGLSQTILKNFLDQYQQTAALYRSGVEMQSMEQLLESQIRQSYTQAVSLSGKNPSETVTYFYALLAMVCLYGSLQGMTSVLYLQANLSPLGARRAISPVGKLRMVCYDLLGGLTVHFICLMVVVIYMVLVLGVDFGSQFGLVLLVCLVGSLTGVAMGAVITAANKLRETVKTAIIIASTLILCFMAGLMVGGINYLIEQSLPVLAWLNPAARIVDAFYCLYYYDTLSRFALDIGVLLAMAAVMFGSAALMLRRKTYESI